MIILSILVALAAIGVLCWLLFTLASFALPALVGPAAGTSTYDSGAGVIGSLAAGITCASLVFGVGQFLILIVRPMWMKIAVAPVFVAPALTKPHRRSQPLFNYETSQLRERSQTSIRLSNRTAQEFIISKVAA